MNEERTPNEQPDFSTLSGMMEYFSKVPFHQFQRELDEWFYKGIAEKKIDLSRLNDADTRDFPEQLRALVDNIYRQSEILERRQDTK